MHLATVILWGLLSYTAIADAAPSRAPAPARDTECPAITVTCPASPHAVVAAPMDDPNQTIAHWTVVLAIAAIAQGVVSTLLWLVSKKSADAANVSAQAAKSTVDTMERNARIQLRAYISVSNFRIVHLTDPNQAAELRLTMRNVGATPAYNCRTSGLFEGIEQPDLPRGMEEVPEPDEAARHSRVTLAPDEPHEALLLMTVKLNEATIRLIADGRTAKIYAVGQVQYEDIFGATHHTRFAIRFGGPKLAAALQAGPLPNGALPGPHLFQYLDQLNECD